MEYINIDEIGRPVVREKTRGDGIEEARAAVEIARAVLNEDHADPEANFQPGSQLSHGTAPVKLVYGDVDGPMVGSAEVIDCDDDADSDESYEGNDDGDHIDAEMAFFDRYDYEHINADSPQNDAAAAAADVVDLDQRSSQGSSAHSSGRKQQLSGAGKNATKNDARNKSSTQETAASGATAASAASAAAAATGDGESRPILIDGSDQSQRSSDRLLGGSSRKDSDGSPRSLDNQAQLSSFLHYHIAPQGADAHVDQNLIAFPPALDSSIETASVAGPPESPAGTAPSATSIGSSAVVTATQRTPIIQASPLARALLRASPLPLDIAAAASAMGNASSGGRGSDGHSSASSEADEHATSHASVNPANNGGNSGTGQSSHPGGNNSNHASPVAPARSQSLSQSLQPPQQHHPVSDDKRPSEDDNGAQSSTWKRLNSIFTSYLMNSEMQSHHCPSIDEPAAKKPRHSDQHDHE